MMEVNLSKGNMCNRMALSLRQKQNMPRTKAHCRHPIWDSIPSLLIKTGILPLSDTGHSVTMYIIMWLPTSMCNRYSDRRNFSIYYRRTVCSGFQNQQLYSDYFLEKGNFFRIDNISLGYTFQKLWNSSSSLRLTFGVQNAATFMRYSGIDPIYSGIDKV